MIDIKFPITKVFQNGKRILFNEPFLSGNEEQSPYIHMEDGFLYALYGNNGIGKTTFMNILALLTPSLLRPWGDKNKIFFGCSSEEDIHSESLTSETGPIFDKSLVRSDNLSFIFQDPHIVNIYTIEENLNIVNSLFDISSDLTLVADKIKNLDLEDYAKDFVLTKFDKIQTEKSATPYYLSGGEKQLMSFVRCMIKPSNIIFADEPWASMDNHLKEFIESQLYAYINDEDVFSDIRNRNQTLSDKKIVMIISHPNHHANNTRKFGKKIDKASYRIPVSNKEVDNYDDLQVLTLDKYKAVK